MPRRQRSRQSVETVEAADNSLVNILEAIRQVQNDLVVDGAHNDAITSGRKVKPRSRDAIMADLRRLHTLTGRFRTLYKSTVALVKEQTEDAERMLAERAVLIAAGHIKED